MILLTGDRRVFRPGDKGLPRPMQSLNGRGGQQLSAFEQFECGKAQTLTASTIDPLGGQQATCANELAEEHGGRHPETMTDDPGQCSRAESSSLPHTGANSIRRLPDRNTDGASWFPVTVIATMHTVRRDAKRPHYGRSVVPIR